MPRSATRHANCAVTATSSTDSSKRAGQMRTLETELSRRISGAKTATDRRGLNLSGARLQALEREVAHAAGVRAQRDALVVEVDARGARIQTLEGDLSTANTIRGQRDALAAEPTRAASDPGARGRPRARQQNPRAARRAHCRAGRGPGQGLHARERSGTGERVAGTTRCARHTGRGLQETRPRAGSGDRCRTRAPSPTRSTSWRRSCSWPTRATSRWRRISPASGRCSKRVPRSRQPRSRRPDLRPQVDSSAERGRSHGVAVRRIGASGLGTGCRARLRRAAERAGQAAVDAVLTRRPLPRERHPARRRGSDRSRRIGRHEQARHPDLGRLDADAGHDLAGGREPPRRRRGGPLGDPVRRLAHVRRRAPDRSKARRWR